MYRPSNNGRRRTLRLACAIAFALLAGIVSAQQDVVPIELTADRAELDNARGLSIYTGNVVLTRGPLRITGDVMRVYTGDDRRLDRIVVEGDPATYQDLPEGESRPVHAEAPRMEYYASGPERIRLLHGAMLRQGDNELHGETIVYNVTEDRVEAQSGAGEDERIRIEIYPNRDSGGGGSR